MKKAILVSLLINFVCGITFASKVISMDKPKREQFIVRDMDGNQFSLDMKIDTVYEILGEPVKKTNLWAKKSDAPCRFYKVEYAGVRFFYYDDDNRVSEIQITGPDFSVVDNGITFGTYYKDVLEQYKKACSRKKINSARDHMVYLILDFTSSATDLEQKANEFEGYAPAIRFFIDDETKNCVQINIYWSKRNLMDEN